MDRDKHIMIYDSIKKKEGESTEHKFFYCVVADPSAAAILEVYLQFSFEMFKPGKSIAVKVCRKSGKIRVLAFKSLPIIANITPVKVPREIHQTSAGLPCFPSKKKTNKPRTISGNIVQVM